MTVVQPHVQRPEQGAARGDVPKLLAIARAVDARPELTALWEANFGE